MSSDTSGNSPAGTNTSTNTSTTSYGGRGGGGRGRNSGRGNRNRNQGGNTINSQKGNNNNKNGQAFKGNTDGMKGNVFQCYGETTDRQQFTKTLGVLSEYINKTFTYPQDVASVCTNFKLTPPTQPKDLTDEEYEKNKTKKMIWETQVKSYVKRLETLESNSRAIYAIVWGQCSTMMQSKLESLPEYEHKNKNCDCEWIIHEIQGITHRFDSTRNIFISLDDAWSLFYAYRQGSDQSLHDFLKDFQCLVQVLEHYGAVFGHEKPFQESVKQRVTSTASPDSSAAAIEKLCINAAKKRYIAISFLKRAHTGKYGGLWTDLENSFSRGLDHYPNDITGAYNLLINYKRQTDQGAQGAQKQHNKTSNPSDLKEENAVAFTQTVLKLVPGVDGITHDNIKCYKCDSMGHFASSCSTAETQPATQFFQYAEPEPSSEETDNVPYLSEYSFMSNGLVENNSYDSSNDEHAVYKKDLRTKQIPSTWILLDSQSTVSVFKSTRFVKNIRTSNRTLRLHTNGGIQTSTKMATVNNFGDVWFNPNSLANILSMAEVRKQCRITMDTNVEAAMCVHKKNGEIMKFIEYETGLYYYDAKDHKFTSSNKHSSKDINAYLFLNTVRSLKDQYTAQEIEGADKARSLFRKLGYPSEAVFHNILNNNLIRNCPITIDDAKRTLHIYVPDITTLKGKTTKQQNNKRFQIYSQYLFQLLSLNGTKTTDYLWIYFGFVVTHFFTQYLNG